MDHDHSQSSDFLDDAADLLTESLSKEQIFHESLLATTKQAFSGYENEIKKSTFPTYFATLLEDSWSCITHSLEDLIKGLLSDTAVPISKIIEYLVDSVFLVQMLTNLYKSIIEIVPISCCSMKTFPRQTGLIIFSVFVHCKDSESIYGHHLKSVEKQLKDLFRICHELQLTYLLILEKHFNFDLTEQEDKSVLVETLKINLSIGKVVQSLDVKTMAEQWKAYTVLCEKYSSSIGDTYIFQDCSQILCTLIKDNIETAVEMNQDTKLTMRSLKVASFTIKILLKVCNIFRQSSNKNYSHILELQQYIRINHVNCLEISAENSLATLINNNVVSPSDCLLKELLLDEDFVIYLFNAVSSVSCDSVINENLFGLLLTVISAVKCETQANRRHQNNLKTKLVTCIYTLLPYSHSWLHRPVFAESNQQTYTLDHILTHTTALALTMTNEEFNALEKYMIEAILGTECVSALFSSYLWVLLANFISPQLLFNQLIWLCTMYKKLDVLKGFYRSPQKVHLTHTLSRLFEVMEDEDKTKFCKQFRIHDEDNMSLWSALRIRNLPVESQQNAEEAIAEKLKSILGRMHDSDSADLLIQITNISATCLFRNTRGIDDQLVKAWSKACQEKQTIVHGLDNNTVWFYDYVTALVALTDSVVWRFREKIVNFVKVLHIISGLIRTGDAEMKLILTNILCKLASYDVSEHKTLTDSHFTDAFVCLLQDDDNIVRSNLLRILNRIQNKNLDRMVDNIVRENSLQEIWHNLKNGSYDLSMEFKGNNFKYTHKCLDSNAKEIPAISVQELKEAKLDDFYFDSGGSEIVVEAEIEEPSSKRGKPNTHEADGIIKNLEENVSLLVRRTVYTPDQLIRIQNVCEMLKNIRH